MRLARYEDPAGRHVGVVLDSGRVVPAPWSGFEGLFAESDPYAALQQIDVTEERAVVPKERLRDARDACSGSNPGLSRSQRRAVRARSASPDVDEIVPNWTLIL